MDIIGAGSALAGLALIVGPVLAMAIPGGLLYFLAWRSRRPKGNLVGRGYSALMSLLAGGWAFMLLTADTGGSYRQEMLSSWLPVSALVFLVYFNALLKPRSQWLVFGLSMSAGSLLLGGGLAVAGRGGALSLGQIIGFVVAAGLIWLVFNTALEPRSAAAASPDDGVPGEQG